MKLALIIINFFSILLLISSIKSKIELIKLGYRDFILLKIKFSLINYNYDSLEYIFIIPPLFNTVIFLNSQFIN